MTESPAHCQPEYGQGFARECSKLLRLRLEVVATQPEVCILYTEIYAPCTV